MSDLGELREQASAIELPLPHLELLPSRQEGLVSGDPARWGELNHPSGENLYDCNSTCGLVSCEGVLHQFGIETSENQLLEHAAVTGHCDLQNGMTSFSDQVSILRDFGVPAHTEHHGTVEGLADNIENGQSVVLEVNAGVLQDCPERYGNGEANHAVLVTGIVRDPTSGEVIGAYINDSSTGESSRFVDRETLESSWSDAGGNCIVTEASDMRDEGQTIGYECLGWIDVWAY